MLEASRQRLLAEIRDDECVLDVGGWGKPFWRADWVIDLFPFATRGLYGELPDPRDERYCEETWLVRDICDREPWPFADGQFDFAICSHTLEDIRDPIWVCSELQRVARAGYVEVPSRLEEQSYGVHGAWVGWGHHRWLIDRVGEGLQFVHKARVLEAERDLQFSPQFEAALTDEERVTTLWWQGTLEATERIFVTREDILPFLRAPVAAHEPDGWPVSRDRRKLLDRLR